MATRLSLYSLLYWPLLRSGPRKQWQLHGWAERMLDQRQERFYRRELDLLRLAAFALVFIGHSLDTRTSPTLRTIGRAGMFGVPVFFALSAYLITELLTREKSAAGTVDLRRFYVRRILRIWPLYFTVLFAGFVLTRNCWRRGPNLIPCATRLFVSCRQLECWDARISSVWNGGSMEHRR
jgi:hypothetical protein